jgi:hypothetical protein
MFRTLATVSASGAVLVALALPASAASAQPTFIDGFASSVTTVAFQQPVTFTGELVEGAGKTPVASEPVQIEIQPPGQGQFVPVATGTTGSDGQFTITTTLPSGGYVRAAFAGDTGLGASYSNPAFGLLLDVVSLPSRLELDPVPGSVSAGAMVDFSGTMEVQVDGTWEPFPGAPLTLTMEPYTSSQPNVTYATTSGADGRFSLTEPVTETSGWSIDTSLRGDSWADWFPDYARSSYGWVDGVSRTQVVAFRLPAREEAHAALSKGLYATGTVERWNGSSWVGLAYGWVDFYYQHRGSKTWHQDSGAQTDAFGQFKGLVGVHLGTANWQVRVQPAADTLTSSSNTVTSTITDRTHFASVDIQRSSSGSSISGQVTDLYKQVSFSSLRGLKLRLYYRSGGSKTWHAYKTAKVGAGGYFHFSVAKSYGFRFKVVLPGHSPYLSCTSRTL